MLSVIEEYLVLEGGPLFLSPFPDEIAKYQLMKTILLMCFYRCAILPIAYR
jgi:hypothetical protein